MKLTDRLIRQLRLNQLPDGAFFSETSQGKNFNSSETHRTVFFNALILQILAGIDNPEAKIIAAKLAKFLHKQVAGDGSFNYWIKSAIERRRCPYPNDLDDTFCALTALHAYNPLVVNGTVLAKIVSLLIKNEIQPGGPYRTWVKPPVAAKWQDVDVAVNANINYFFQIQNIKLPSLQNFLSHAIIKKQIYSPYYAGWLPVAYFLSRICPIKLRATLSELLTSRQLSDGSWGNLQDTALATIALLNVGLPKAAQKGARWVEQNSSQASLAYPFGVERVVQNEKFYSGCAAFTATLVIRVLHFPASQKLRLLLPRPENEQAWHARTIRRVEKPLSQLPQPLKTHVKTALRKFLTQEDTDHQVVLLSLWFAQGLGRRKQKIIEPLLPRLGAANLYGWTAWRIYDDLIDGSGDPAYFAAADWLFKNAAATFLKACPDQAWENNTQTLLAGLGQASAWEARASQCRERKGGSWELPKILPKFGVAGLCGKSLADALGPLIILSQLGYAPASATAKSTTNFFRYYLAARQLNDDAHDWEADLQHGRLNSSSALLFSNWPQRHWHWQKDRQKLRRMFWQKVAPKIARKILLYAAGAENSLAASEVEILGEFADRLLAPQKNAARQVLDEHKKAREFLRAYKA